MNSHAAGIRATDGDPDGLLTDFSGQLSRTVELLRTTALARLSLADDEGLTPTSRAHALSQYLVDLAWGLSPDSFPASGAGGSLAEPPPAPEVRSHGAGAQLAVVGRELLLAAKAQLITADGERQERIQAALTDASQACIAVRRAL